MVSDMSDAFDRLHAASLILGRRAFLGGALAGVASPALAGVTGDSAPGTEAFPPMMPDPRVYRMYDGEDGKTHIDRIKLKPRRISLGVPLGSSNMEASQKLMAAGPVNLFQAKDATVNLIADPPRQDRGNPHWSVRPALALIIQGLWEFGTTDGDFVVLEPGDFLKVEDHSPTHGGHTQRVLGPQWGLEIATFWEDPHG